MFIRVDPSAPEPLFAQLAGAIRTAVVQGDVVTGERLPSAKELAASLDVNVHTVLRAYQILRDEGLLELRRGRGAVISASPHDWTDLQKALEVVAAESVRLGLSHDATTSLVRSAIEQESS